MSETDKPAYLKASTFWSVISLVVPATFAAFFYMIIWSTDYCMLQVTNTEQRCDRQDARIANVRRMQNIMLLTQFGKTPEEAAVLIDEMIENVE